jgi:uncharacterized small protein (DUF1192 family)
VCVALQVGGLQDKKKQVGGLQDEIAALKAQLAQGNFFRDRIGRIWQA